MATKWYREPILWLFILSLVIEVMASINLASDLGKRSLGVLLEYETSKEELRVAAQTPSWWRGLQSVEGQKDRLYPGDILWSTDTSCFQNSWKSVIQTILNTSNNTIKLNVLRGGKCISLFLPVVTITQKEWTDIWLPNFILWIGYLLLAIAVFYAAPSHPMNRSTAYVMGTAAILFSLEWFSIYPIGRPTYWLLEIFSIISKGMIASSLFSMGIYFPTSIPFKYRQKLLRGIYIGCTVLVIMYLFSRMSALLFNRAELWIVFLLNSLAGMLGLVFVAGRIIAEVFHPTRNRSQSHLIFILAGVLFSLPFLINHSQAVSTPIGIEVSIILFGIWFVYTFIKSNRMKGPGLLRKLVIFISLFLVLGVLLSIVGLSNVAHLYFFDFSLKYLMLFVPLTFAYVILRYRSFQGANYFLIFVLVLTLSAFTASTIVSNFYVEHMISAHNPYFSSLLLAFFPFGLLFSFQGSIRGALGRFIQRQELNYQAVKEFGENVAGQIDHDDLRQQILRGLKDTLKLSYVVFWEYQQENNGFILLEQSENQFFDLQKFIPLLAENNPLPDKPFRLRDQAAIPDIFTSLKDSSYLEIGVCLLAPDSKKPLGIIGLGPRDREEFFDNRDLEVIDMIAEQISLILLTTNLVEQGKIANQWVAKAEENERARISRDLHDSVSQSLNGLGKVLETVIRKLSEKYDIAEIRSLVQACVDETYDAAINLRRIMNNLAYQQLQGIAVRVFEQYIADFQQRTSLTITSRVDIPENISFSQPPMNALYWVLRQALDNIYAHAEATKVVIEICKEGSQIKFLIVDNGHGFSESRRSEAIEQKHFGLWSMEERIRQVGGEFAIHSMIGEGTELRGSLPV